RRVRLVQVEEGEERLPRLAVEPHLESSRGLTSVAFLARAEVVIEEIEAARDSALSPKKKRGDRGPGRIPVLLQQLLDRGDRRRQTEPHVIAHAVRRRKHSREDGDVRRERQRNVAVGAPEQNRIGTKR